MRASTVLIYCALYGAVGVLLVMYNFRISYSGLWDALP